MTSIDLGWPAFSSLLVISVLVGIGTHIAFRRWSDQQAIERSKSLIVAYLLEFRLFIHEPRLVLRAQRNLVRENLRLIRLLLRPALIVTVPMLILFEPMDALYGHAPVRVGEPVIVTIQSNRAVDPHLQPPAGILVETPPVHISREHQASWRIRAVRPVSARLEIMWRDRVLRKHIAAGSGGFHFLFTRSRYLFDDNINWFEIRYPVATILRLHWLVWFFILSTSTVLLLNTRLHRFRPWVAFVLISTAALPGRAATVSPLFARGYTVIPTPQNVTLGTRDFEFTPAWRLELAPEIKPDDAAIQSLQEGLRERFGMTLSGSRAAAGVVHLTVAPGRITVGGTIDKDKPALAEQAYRLELASNQVTITGNTATGLFYGVQTFLQLLKADRGKLRLPEGTIQDWPDLQLRVIYWDDAHHLEHLDVLKAALRQAAFYKINGFSLKLEGHFQYRHAPPIVEPYALTPAELQELTDYGLKYHVQLIPYLDAPAHDAFILKHPEYAGLREYPESNYEFCATNPGTYELLKGMFDDLLAANKGGKYFVLSTDEPYYVGLADNQQCREAQRAKQLGSVGKTLAEFVTKAADYLHDHSRTVIFWGESPLKPDDIAALPAHLVNGEIYGPQFDPVFRAHGIRQLIYTSTEGEEQLFPQYYILPSWQRLHPGPTGPGRVQEMFEHASFSSPDTQAQADLMGMFVAGWADAGLHPETFWLGYATGPAGAWHRSPSSSQELESSFYTLFYGPGGTDMGALYQLMSEQAQFWEDSWETGPSAARTPIFGNSYGVFHPPRPAHDQYLPALPAPSGELLHVDGNWRLENAKRLEFASRFLAQNDRLLDLLYLDLQRVHFNRYNLEVYLSIAGLCRQNLLMLQDLGRISDDLKTAEASAARGEAERAIASLDQAINTAENISRQRNKALQDATETWYKSWFPRVPEANGRRYLDQVDDVKDHQPVRTVDMSYLIYRELLYPLDTWANKVIAVRNAYAAAHHLPVHDYNFK